MCYNVHIQSKKELFLLSLINEGKKKHALLRITENLSYPNLRYSDPPRIELTVHLASLQLLFLNSVASTAPRCESSFWRQSTPTAWKKKNQNTDNVYTVTNTDPMQLKTLVEKSKVQSTQNICNASLFAIRILTTGSSLRFVLKDWAQLQAKTWEKERFSAQPSYCYIKHTSGSILEVRCCPCRKMVGVRYEDITWCWRSLEKESNSALS